MAVPVPSISCCVLNHHNLFYQIQNALAFNQDTCCHLVLCLRLLPFHWEIFHRELCKCKYCLNCTIQQWHLHWLNEPQNCAWKYLNSKSGCSCLGYLERCNTHRIHLKRQLQWIVFLKLSSKFLHKKLCQCKYCLRWVLFIYRLQR
jgi:hypothetical protein